MTTPLALMEPMRREHQSWLEVCRMLASRDINLNEDDPLAAALNLWGENLATLRLRNISSADAQRALDAAEAKFNQTVGFLPYHETATERPA